MLLVFLFGECFSPLFILDKMGKKKQDNQVVENDCI